MNKDRIPFGLNTVLFVVTLVLNLSTTLNPPVWKGYGDPYDYLHQSEIPLCSKEFYFPKKTEHFYPRPFTVPILYKIVGSQPGKIIIMQKIMHALSVFFLGHVILFFFKKLSSKILFIAFLHLLMSWWNILGWTHTLLSESLSISLLFIWLASFLLFFRIKTIYSFVFHALITIFFSFTRDSWPYIIVLFYILYALIAFLREKTMMKYLFGLIAIGLIVFVVQQNSAKIGQRYRLPIMNNIVFRILPNHEYLQWFSKKGMPNGEELRVKYGNLDNWKEVYTLYNDTGFIEFSEWVLKNGKSVYTKFLITHPAFSLLIHEKPNDLKKILSYNIGYTGDVKGYSKISQNIFPIFNVISLTVLNAFLVFLYLKSKKIILLFPSVLMIVFSFNAYLLYIADALEIERHLFITNIMIQFIGILTVMLIIDAVNLQDSYNIIKLRWVKLFRK